MECGRKGRDGSSHQKPQSAPTPLQAAALRILASLGPLKALFPVSFKEALKLRLGGTRPVFQPQSTPPPLESLPDAPEFFRVYRHLCEHADMERRPGGWLYRDKFYPDYLTVGGASHAIFRKALEYCRGVGVDIGAGLWPLPSAIPVDVRHGPGVGRAVSDFADGSLDYVFSSHCLEHLEKWKEALSVWVGRLRPGGIIFLYLPHPDCEIWHPGSPIVGSGHKWIPTPHVVKEALSKLVGEIVDFDDGPDAMQSFYVCGRKEHGDNP